MEAQFNLGDSCHYGYGAVQQDNKELIKWFNKAAKQGQAEAQFHLGLAIFNGWELQEDDAEAAFRFEKADS